MKRAIYTTRATEEGLFGDLHMTKTYNHMKQLVEKGIQVFGTKAKFLIWIDTENEALGGNTPDSILDSSIGSSIVFDLLMQIEKGVVS